MYDIHKKRARWVLNILDSTSADSELTAKIVNWFTYGLGTHYEQNPGYKWLNLNIPNFPKSDTIKSSKNRNSLPEWQTEEYESLKKKDRRTYRTNLLRKHLERTVHTDAPDAVKSALEKNLTYFGEKLGITDQAVQYLLLISNIQESAAARELAAIIIEKQIDEQSNQSYANGIATILGQSNTDIADYINEETSPLMKHGLLQKAGAETGDRSIKFYYGPQANDVGISSFFIQIITDKIITEENINNVVFGKPISQKLLKSDFTHMARQLDIVLDHLGNTDNENLQSPAVVLEGVPGVGKSQLVGVIARELQMPVYFIGQTKSGNENSHKPIDTEMTRKEVLAELRFKNHLAKRLGIEAGFVLEEADGVLRQAHTQKSDQTSKGHLNMVLEELTSPVIFTTNSIDDMERATIRRILPVIPVESPPDPTLAKIMCHTAEKGGYTLKADEALHLIETYPGLSTGELERVVQVACARRGTEPASHADFIAKLELSLQLARRALNGGLEEPAKRTIIPAGYKPALVPMSYPQSEIRSAFARAVQAGKAPHIALIGHSGAGKRTFARHLFEQAGMRVNEVPLSSLIGMTAYSAIIDLFQTASASKKGLLITHSEKLLLSHEAPQDFLLLRAMQDSKTPVIMTANLAAADDCFDYTYFSKIQNYERPDNVVIRNAKNIPTMPTILRNNFSLVVQLMPLQGDILRRAYIDIVGDDAGEALLNMKGIFTMGDLDAVRRGLDFMQVDQAHRAEVGLQMLRQQKAPLMGGEHHVETTSPHKATNDATAHDSPKPPLRH